MYPRYFLTHHFWTLQQRSEFAVMNLRDRLSHNLPVFRALQSKLSSLKNDRHYDQWDEILGKLGSGVHPTANEIISVKDLFSEAPYKTTSLNYTHIVSAISSNTRVGVSLNQIAHSFFVFSFSFQFSLIGFSY